MKNNSLIPKLGCGQCSVIFAEVNTGIVLTPEGKYHIGQTDCFLMFNSVDEALAFTRSYIEQHPEIKCSIYDENGNHIKLIKKQMGG